MINGRLILFLCPVFVSLFVEGCHSGSYITEDLSKNSTLNIIDINICDEMPDMHKTGREIEWSMMWSLDPEAASGGTFDVNYVNYYSHGKPTTVHIPVEVGRGHTYKANVDTGFGGACLFTGDIVLKEKFSIIPRGTHGRRSLFQGICLIPSFRVGAFYTEDAPCYYAEQQWQKRFMGMPISKRSDILIGIDFLKCFKYVAFDGVHQRVQFSHSKSFRPSEPLHGGEWIALPMRLDHPESFNERILVDIPVVGQYLTVMFDSGGTEPGLRLHPNDWRTIFPYVGVRHYKTVTVNYWQWGRRRCKRAMLEPFEMAGMVMRDKEVDIYDRVSMMSLVYFHDTTVVIDFENSLLWIRKRS